MCVRARGGGRSKKGAKGGWIIIISARAAHTLFTDMAALARDAERERWARERSAHQRSAVLSRFIYFIFAAPHHYKVPLEKLLRLTLCLYHHQSLYSHPASRGPIGANLIQCRDVRFYHLARAGMNFVLHAQNGRERERERRELQPWVENYNILSADVLLHHIAAVADTLRNTISVLCSPCALIPPCTLPCR